MLTPKYIEQITENIERLAASFHIAVIKRIIERLIARARRGDDTILTASDAHQLNVLQEAGMLRKDLEEEIAKVTGRGKREIHKAFTDAGVKNDRLDAKTYEAAGISETPLMQSPKMIRIIQRDMEVTANTFDNLTRTTADVAQQAFIQACNSAYQKANSGLMSMNEAYAEAIEELAANGVKMVTYTKTDTEGNVKVHTDTIETATLRAVRTGITQCAGKISLERLIENHWDIVLVSAHLGARDKGEGVENHAKWQGKFYSLFGESKFPNFYEATGYGTGEGLCGWNCRHSFGAGDGKFNPYKIDEEKNHEAYEKSQVKRAYERAIRKQTDLCNRLYEACKNMPENDALKDKYERNFLKLQKMNERYIEWCAENNERPIEYRLLTGILKGNNNGKTIKSTAIKAGNTDKTVKSKYLGDTDRGKPIKNARNTTEIHLQDATPNSHEIKNNDKFVFVDGEKYEVDGKHVVFDPSPREKEVANMLKETFGGEIALNPKINEPAGVQCADFDFNGQRWDLKTLPSDSVNGLKRRLEKSKGQTNNFIYDTSNSPLSEEDKIKSIENVFWSQNTSFVERIMWIDKDGIIAIYERA